MKHNDKFDTEKLSQLPILEVANKLGLKLDRNNKCHCFLHEERTPSFSVDKRKNRWKCFGCGEGGGVIRLVEKYNKCDFQTACKWLSNAFGIAKYNLPSQKSTPRNEVKIKLTVRNKPDTEVYQWFFDNLSMTEKARDFLKARKYPDTIITEYNLKGVDDCKTFFQKCVAKWGAERLIKCGLAKEYADKNTGEILTKFTWWTDTLFFPFYDMEGHIVYIQGRTLDIEKKWKYINLDGVETALFNQPLLKTLKKNDSLVITEGVTDCISCCLMGKNAVGVIGAHGFKKEFVNLLRDFDIAVIPDNDANKTGEKFADKIRNEFYSIGKTVKVYPLKLEYKDISEYYMKGWNNE